jgi:hypothetical protein
MVLGFLIEILRRRGVALALRDRGAGGRYDRDQD